MIQHSTAQKFWKFPLTLFWYKFRESNTTLLLQKLLKSWFHDIFFTLWKFSPFEIRIQSSMSSSTKLCSTIKTISILFWHNFHLHKIFHFLSERYEKSVKSGLLGLFCKTCELGFSIIRTSQELFSHILVWDILLILHLSIDSKLIFTEFSS